MTTDPSAAAKIGELRKHLEHASEEIQELWLDRYVWRKSSDIAAESDAVERSPFFMTWVGTQYYRRVAMCIRSMADKRRDSHSLLCLLELVRRNHQHIECPSWMPDDYRTPGSSTLSSRRVQQDIAELRDALEPVVKYAHEHLAHIKKDPQAVLPDPSALDRAVELLGIMLRRYTLLLTGNDLEVEPRVLFEWTDTFNEAWRPDAPPAG
jgi:hypothetical protein